MLDKNILWVYYTLAEQYERYISLLENSLK